MLIAQITDLHLGFVPDDPEEANAQRLRAVVAAILKLDPAPDMVLATGDLTEAGTPRSYADLKAILSALPMPVHFAMGNHDDRANFGAAFPDAVFEGGFLQYVVDTDGLRIIVLDTLETGRHGGSFCDDRAAWLEARLSEAPEMPTLLVLHHPPVATDIPWMTILPGEPWVDRLKAVISRHPQVIRLVAGHVHRTILAPFAHTFVSVCPSTAPQVALEMREIDPDRPDGRPLIVIEPPTFGLHSWRDGTLTSHTVFTGEHKVVAAYTPALQPMIRTLVAERDAGGA